MFNKQVSKKKKINQPSLIREKIIKLCAEVYDDTEKFVHFSSNKEPSLEKTLIQCTARSRKFHLGKYKELIKCIHLNLHNQDPKLLDRTLVGKFEDQENISLGTLLQKANAAFNQKLKEPKKTHKDGRTYKLKERIENSVKNAILFGIGNCGELSRIAMCLLLQNADPFFKEKKIKIELMKLSLTDHAFLVVNRQSNSNIEDLSTWGNDAFIIDPWVGDVIHAKTGKSMHQFTDMDEPWDLNFYSDNKPQIIFSSTIGNGLSPRFHERCNKKNRPILLKNWAPKYSYFSDVDSKKENLEVPHDMQNNKRKRDF